MVRTHHRYAFVAALAVLALVGIGIGKLMTAAPPPTVNAIALDRDGLPVDPVSYEFIHARPDAHLVYPGAKLVRALGSAQEPGGEGSAWNSAFDGGIYVTDDAPSVVYDWYNAQATSRGYQAYEIGRLSTESSAKAWKRGPRERLSVGMDDPAALKGTIPVQLPGYGTVFEETYTIFPSPTPSPSTNR